MNKIACSSEFNAASNAAGDPGETPCETHLVPVVERFFLSRSDLGNGERLARRFNPRIRYSPGRGWAVWNGARFVFGAGEDRALGLFSGLSKLVLEEVEAVEAVLNTEKVPASDGSASGALDEVRGWNSWEHREQIDAHRKHVRTCQSLRSIRSAMALARGELVTESQEFDRRLDLLNCANGALDQRAFKQCGRQGEHAPCEGGAPVAIGPHDPAHLFTKCAAARYDPDADGRRWESFLTAVLPDPKVRSLLQCALGSALFGVNPAQIALFLHGRGGNGKSTLMNAVAHALGDYAVPCKIELLMVDRHGGSASAPNPEEMRLPGGRLYVCPEPEVGDRLSAKKIKLFTGGDARPIRAPYATEEAVYRPSGVPIILCNRLPLMDPQDEGLRRRVHVVPFDQRLDQLPVGRRRSQSELERELRADASAILNWLLDGSRAYANDGLGDATVPAMLTVGNGGAVKAFLSESVARSSGARVSKKELHAAHSLWADEHGQKTMPFNAFNRSMKRLGYAEYKSGGLMHWRDLGLE